jgi:ABC-type multidrug transport system ATPase subunit
VVDARSLQDDRTILLAPGDVHDAISLGRSFVVSTQTLIGRDEGRVQIHLPHPNVSRVHAQVSIQGSRASVVDLKSANGTFVNGRRIVASTALRPGDRIDVGPFALAFDGRSLTPHSRDNNVELVGHNLVRTVTDPATRQSLTILDRVSLVVRPREFVCIIGPSGSGKSSLLSALSARVPADAGEVLINETDLYANFEALKKDIAVVPQRDAIHDGLTVEDALTFSARLRLPPDTDPGEIRRVVDEILNTVGLDERRRTQIRHLSGGQLKRAGLANEIISQPTLLFIDEATSGLDEHTDLEMMTLFRRLADSGKTVVCVTHNLVNIDASSHLVVVLATGGKLAFVGKCAEALQHFGVMRLGDIFPKLAKVPAAQWCELFRTCPLFDRYVRSRMPNPAALLGAAPAVATRTWLEEASRFRHQLKILLCRYIHIQLADWSALAATAVQCLLVALLLSILYGDLTNDPPDEQAQQSSTLSFLIAVSCLWFGCNNAAKEIVKERIIYTRERAVNLSIVSYFSSKALPLGALSVLQAWWLILFVKVFTGMPGSLPAQCLCVAWLAAAGTAMGLAISVVAKSEDFAIAAVPIVLIPQIVLGGVVAPVTGLSKFLAQVFVSSYWGYRSMAAALPPKSTVEDLSVVGNLSIVDGSTLRRCGSGNPNHGHPRTARTI